MISHDHFGALRLAQFLPEAEIEELRDWEFMEHLWVGEAIGFSEWLRLKDEPDILRSMAIDFSEFPKSASDAVLRTIDLPIYGGMTFEQLQDILGEPYETQRFVTDRVTYEFIPLEGRPYEVSCAVLNEGGLAYLVLMVPLAMWHK
jgi:hypothetical protein